MWGLGEGEYWFVATHPEWAPVATSVQASGDITEAILKFSTAPGRAIEFAGEDGEPVTPMLFRIFIPDGPPLWETRPVDSSVTVPLAEGSYEALVKGPGGIEERHSFTVTDDDTPIRIPVP